MMSKIILSEAFPSIQGEGVNLGRPSFFIRMGGCNLSCKWCDSSFASYRVAKPELVAKPEEIVSHLVDKYEAHAMRFPKQAIDHFVITGGEPLLPQNQGMYPLLAKELSDRLNIIPHLEFETNGTQSPEFRHNLLYGSCSFSVSPKLKTSFQLHARQEEERTQLAYEHWSRSSISVRLKFVVNEFTFPQDIQEIEECLDGFGPSAKLMKRVTYLMPEGNTFNKPWYQKVAEYCWKNGYNFSPRVHVILWGDERCR